MNLKKIGNFIGPLSRILVIGWGSGDYMEKMHKLYHKITNPIIDTQYKAYKSCEFRQIN